MVVSNIPLNLVILHILESAYHTFFSELLSMESKIIIFLSSLNQLYLQ